MVAVAVVAGRRGGMRGGMLGAWSQAGTLQSPRGWASVHQVPEPGLELLAPGPLRSWFSSPGFLLTWRILSPLQLHQIARSSQLRACILPPYLRRSLSIRQPSGAGLHPGGSCPGRPNVHSINSSAQEGLEGGRAAGEPELYLVGMIQTSWNPEPPAGISRPPSERGARTLEWLGEGMPSDFFLPSLYILLPP